MPEPKVASARLLQGTLVLALIGISALILIRRHRPPSPTSSNFPPPVAVPSVAPYYPTTSAEEMRRVRQTPVTTVAPAPLPVGLPLAGPPGTMDGGYPRQHVDKAALRSLLWHGRFAELTHDVEELQARFEADPFREYWPIEASDAFDSPEAELGTSLDAWVKATPASFAPYLARGAHRRALAYARRGGDYASATPDEDMAEMQSGLAGALADLEQARRLCPKLVAATRLEMQVKILASGHEREVEKLADDAMAACPSCFQVRVVYLFTLTPRWGGSYAAMDAFAKRSAGAGGPLFATLGGYADLDRARLLHAEKKDDEARASLERALAFGRNYDFLYERARLELARHDLPAARADLEAVLVAHPGRTDASFLLTFVDANDHKWEAAGRHLLAGLRVKPTDADARKIWGNVVSGIQVEGWKLFQAQKRDDALRLYDLAADLAPQDADLLQRRVAIVVGRESVNADQAIAAAEQAYKGHPDDFRALQRLDYDLARKHDYARIVDLWDAYLAKHPDDGPAHMERGGALEHLGRDGDARAAAARACDLGVSEGCVHAAR